jgi:hypothetical protein
VLRFLLVAQVDLRCRNSPVQLLTLRSRFCHCRCTFLGTGLGAGIWPRQSRFLLDLGHAPGRVAPSILPLGIFVLSPEELRLPRRLRKGSSNPYCSSVLLLNCGLSWEQVFGFGFCPRACAPPEDFLCSHSDFHPVMCVLIAASCRRSCS